MHTFFRFMGSDKMLFSFIFYFTISIKDCLLSFLCIALDLTLFCFFFFQQCILFLKSCFFIFHTQANYKITFPIWEHNFAWDIREVLHASIWMWELQSELETNDLNSTVSVNVAKFQILSPFSYLKNNLL